MSLLKRFGRNLAAFTAIAATAGATPASEPKHAAPAMWKVADSDTTIYLFGTIHLLPKGTSWRSPAFDKAAAGSDALVVETLVDEAHPEATISELFKLAISDGLPPLSARVPADKKAALEAAIAKSGIPAAVLDKMETWAAAFTLLGIQYKEIGLAGENGPEQTLRDAFAAARKPVGQLETNAEQLGFFDVLPESAQQIGRAHV